LFKLAKESALPVPEAARILRELIPSFVILVVEHDDVPTPGKRCVLRRGHGGPDTLEVSYALEHDSTIRQRLAEKALLRRMRRLGCWPFSRIDPGHGSSIHYGGCFPMSRHDRELTVTPSCLLRGTRTVYLADGSVLPHLPAKPLTFTLMANADRVGRAVIAGLRA
ncbi:MAG TPA: GMC oxidoreductase, partial [Candidatus Polarisedimenticolia bacterium]|nr:GMC oxidoreductase [Candidatus Polarisedimenticolia bacterium]